MMIVFHTQSDCGGYWERVTVSRHKLWSKEEAEKLLEVGDAVLSDDFKRAKPMKLEGFPAVHRENMLGNRSKYNVYVGDRTSEPDIIEDYADPVGRENWKDYVVVKDPRTGMIREGPKPFRSKKERLSYERLTNQRQRDPSESAQNGSNFKKAGDKLHAEAKEFFLKKLKEVKDG